MYNPVEFFRSEYKRQADERFMLEPLRPKYPEGTPEYAAYAARLRTELKKFANNEPPYTYNPFPED